MNWNSRGIARGARKRRGGSIYLLTLGLALVITVIGLAAVAIGRVNARATNQSQDWMEAQSLAFSAAEHAMLQIDRTGNWRTVFNGQTVQQSLGRGTLTWQVLDEADGDLTNNPNDPFTIAATGAVGQSSYSVRVHMTAPQGGGMVAGVSTGGSISLSSNATIDSFDSTNGPYGGANVGSQAIVKTNSTAPSTVSLSSNARIKGSVQVGPNSNPNQVIYLGSNGQITGAKTAMPQAMALPTLTAPTGLGASTGNLTYASNQQATVSGNLHVNNLKLSSNSKMKISGNVTILAEGYLSISSNSGIEVLPNSTLKMYVKGAMTFSSNAATAIDGTNLSSATFYNLGTNTVSLSSNAVVKGVIVSPTAPVSLSSNAQVFGAVMASQLNLSSNAAVHEDKRITNQVDRVSLPGSGSSKPRPDSWNRIVQ